MKTKIILSLAFLTCILAVNVRSQEEKPQSLDDYIATGKTIVIAKCISVEPVMRSGTILSKVQILHVLKGNEKLREITVSTYFISLGEGTIYMLRTENAKKDDGNYFRIKSMDSIVALSPYEDIEELKNLPLKTAVGQIIYSRKSSIERQIQYLTDERKLLEQILKEEN